MNFQIVCNFTRTKCEISHTVCDQFTCAQWHTQNVDLHLCYIVVRQIFHELKHFRA